MIVGEAFPIGEKVRLRTVVTEDMVPDEVLRTKVNAKIEELQLLGSTGVIVGSTESDHVTYKADVGERVIENLPQSCLELLPA